MTTTPANARQVGGDHYASKAIQHSRIWHPRQSAVYRPD